MTFPLHFDFSYRKIIQTKILNKKGVEKMKKAVAVVLSLVMCLALITACNDTTTNTDGNTNSPGSPGTSAPPPASVTPSVGWSATESPAPPPVTANFAESIVISTDNNVITSIDVLSPASNTPGSNQTFTMIHDRLLNYDFFTAEYLPGLAVDWNTTDYKTFTFKLREGVKFHNGEPFTAADVIFTCNAAQNSPGTMASAQWGPIETIRAIDPMTVEMVLATVNVDFLFNMAMPMAGIINEKAVASDPENGSTVGTGAFKYFDFISGDHVTVERNDDWWNRVENGGDREIPTRFITIRYIAEVAARAVAIQNGETQIALSLGSEDMHLFQNNPNYTIELQTSADPQGMSFNITHPPLDDINLRSAIIHGINREEATIVGAGDWGAPQSYDDGTTWGLVTPFRNNNLPGLAYDPELAKEYLAMSSYNGEVIEIAAAQATNIMAAESIQRNLAEIGINISINQTDLPTLNAMYNAWGTTGVNTSQIVLLGWQFSGNPGCVRNIFSPSGTNNRSSFNNEEVNELLAQAYLTTDLAAREAMFHRIQEIVYENRIMMNVMWRIFGQVCAKGVGGAFFPPDTAWTDFRGSYQNLDA